MSTAVPRLPHATSSNPGCWPMMRRIFLSCAAVAVLLRLPATRSRRNVSPNSRPATAPKATGKGSPRPSEARRRALPGRARRTCALPDDRGDAEGQVAFLRQSLYRSKRKGRYEADCTYRAWLKKPNYFRVEAESARCKKKPRRREKGRNPDRRRQHALDLLAQGRFQYGFEDPKAYEKTRLTSYMTKPAPPGGHSIGHETVTLGPG